MLVNLNDLYSEIYKNIKYSTNAEVDFDLFLHAQSYLARELNSKFNKSMSWNQIYQGDDADKFSLGSLVTKIEINNMGTAINITSADESIAAVLTKLESAEDNAMAIFHFIPSVYRVERLYFKEDGSITFFDLCSMDELNKSFTTDKGLAGYSNIDGSGSVLDLIWSSIYFRNNGEMPESRVKQYKDKGDMCFGGNFAFENSKMYLPKEIMTKYIDVTSIPNFELSGYISRGIDVYSASTSYALAGYSIFVPDYLYDLYSKSVELMLRQAKGVAFDELKASVIELTDYARRNELDQINLVDRRKESVF